MTRPRRELGIAHSPKLATQRVTCDRYRELVPYPLGKIGKPPAHHPVRRGDRACLDDLGQTSTLLVVQDRCAPGCFAGRQTIGSVRVGAQHPVPNDLQRDPG